MNENEAIEYLQSRYLAVGSRVNPPKEECERHNEVIDMAIKALEEVQQYRAIGTTEECRAAVEKQMAKKPINTDDEYGTFQCPNCNGLIFTVDRFETHKHCLLCGQLLDWSDEE